MILSLCNFVGSKAIKGSMKLGTVSVHTCRRLGPFIYRQCRYSLEWLKKAKPNNSASLYKYSKDNDELDASSDSTSLYSTDPQPWKGDVAYSSEQLFETLAKFFETYLSLKSRAQAYLLGFWVMQAHVLPAFDISPRLNLTSSEKGCGKTTALDVLGELLPKTIRMENCSPAVLFHLAPDQPTILIDEYDTFIHKDKEFAGLLNAGYRRRTKVGRIEGQKVKAYDAYSPVVLAGISNLPETLQDRSLVVHLERAEPDSISRFDDAARCEGRRLHSKIARWSNDHIELVRESAPRLPTQAYNRLADNWRPIFSIAEVAGGNCINRANEAFTYLNT